MDFDDLRIYTQTVIANTNWLIDVDKIFERLEVTKYLFFPAPRKNSSSKSKKGNLTTAIDFHLQKLKEGSIITIKYKDRTRGVDIKEMKKLYSNRTSKSKKKSNIKPFRNSMMIVMKIAGKKITLKLPSFGRIQFCGCKEQNHAVLAVKHLFRNIYSIYKKDKTVLMTLSDYPSFMSEKPTNYKISEKMENDPEFKNLKHNPKDLFQSVMINKDFNLGFVIDRNKLNAFINSSTEYTSLLETSVNTSANIKIKSNPNFRPPLKQIILEKKWTDGEMKYRDYLEHLNNVELKKEKKDKYHTFLMFQSGAIILSSPYLVEMKMVFDKFVKYVLKHKEVIEEKLIEESKEFTPTLTF